MLSARMSKRPMLAWICSWRKMFATFDCLPSFYTDLIAAGASHTDSVSRIALCLHSSQTLGLLEKAFSSFSYSDTHSHSRCYPSCSSIRIDVPRLNLTDLVRCKFQSSSWCYSCLVHYFDFSFRVNFPWNPPRCPTSCSLLSSLRIYFINSST